jgi:hypothetical protein
MVTLKFHNLTKFNEFLKYHIDLVESFSQNTAVIAEELNSSTYDRWELLEGIDYEYGNYFTYIYE